MTKMESQLALLEDELAKILAILFSKCLEKSYFPNNWNIAVMMVLYRKVEEKKRLKIDRPAYNQ